MNAETIAGFLIGGLMGIIGVYILFWVLSFLGLTLLHIIGKMQDYSALRKRNKHRRKCGLPLLKK